ncbi:MAG: efflux RND transporter permease subunit [Leptospira sp.]|nr:efflux RND transporter permease subunit [Leptospira sp.]
MKYEIFLRRSRFFWLIGISATIIGIISWTIIPKEEDPRLKNRFGNIQIVYPGASVGDIRKYVVIETEKELASIDAIEKISTTIRSGFIIIQINLKPEIKDDFVINRTWDEVEEALQISKRLYPSGVQEPVLNRKSSDQEAVLVSISAGEDIRHGILLDLENELLKESTVSRVKRLGETGEEVSIEVNERYLASSGMDLNLLLGQILLANQQLSSGYIENSNQRINIKTKNSFDDVEDLKNLPIATSDGYSKPLSYFADVKKQPKGPQSEEMRWNGKEVIGLGIVAKQNIDLRKFGASIDKIIEKYSESIRDTCPDCKIEIINSQAYYVSERLSDLSFSLLSSILLLSGFMILFMGVRVGLSVSLMLPLISLISFGIYAIMGGILHQIAIAAFVLSFGILIDNIVVIVENIQEKLNQGVSPFQSGLDTIQEFLAPLFSSTLTTIASFLPMALAKDTSAEFTEAIPKIVITSLIVSYIASITLSPSFALKFLKPKKKKISKDTNSQAGNSIIESVGRMLARISLHHKFKTSLFLLTVIVLIVSLIPFMKFKFFPSADRNQMIMEVSFAEGTSFLNSKNNASVIESRLAEMDELAGYASFIGRSTAYFYYNLPQKPNAPHLIQYILISKDKSFPVSLQEKIYNSLEDLGARIRIKSLEQGPPVEASIVLRVYHKDRELWKKRIQEYIDDLSSLDGVSNAWSDSFGLQEEVTFYPNDKKLVELGASRRDLSVSLLKQTYGLNAGNFKSSQETIPIVLSSNGRENSDIKSLNDSLVSQLPTIAIRTKDVSRLVASESEAVHHHFNRKSYVSLLIDLKKNVNPNGIINKIEDMLRDDGLIAGIDYEFDGDKGNSDNSNSALLETLPIGITILLAALMWEFNSFVLLGIIMTSVPFAFLGMIPGLVFAGQPFGFMTLLSLFALIGIAVNNGIILIDRFNNLSKEMEVEKAIQLGIASRLRPIFLTTGSTILGMLPLGFSNSTLWPPFAWAMISGLLVSSIFTLVVVPILYSTFYKKSKSGDSSQPLVESIGTNTSPKKGKKGILTLFLFLLSISILSLSLSADDTVEKIGFQQAISLAKNSSRAKASYHEAGKARQGLDTAKRSVYYPKVGVFAEAVHRDKDLFLSTPIGPAVFGNRTFSQTGLEIYQTLWSPKNIDHLIPSVEKLAEASLKRANWESKNASYQAINSYIDCSILLNRKNITEKRIQNFKKLKSELIALKSRGKSTDKDVVGIDRNLGILSRAFDNLNIEYNTCSQNLGRLLGKENPVEPIIDSIPNFSIPDSSVLNQMQREDLQALALRMEAVMKEKKLESMDSLPEFYARGNLNYSDQANLRPFAFSQISVGVRMNLTDGGVSDSRSKEKDQELKILQEEYKDAVNLINISKKDFKSKLDMIIQHMENLEIEIKRTESTLKVERSRANSGRTPYTDYFQIKDTFLSITEDYSVMEWEFLRAKCSYAFSYGWISNKNQEEL